ncbi:MAG: bifunctional riboflavin kinase/FAD synthetase [Armatimonadota bacterium]
MSIFWGLENYAPPTSGAAITIGAFDGVHRGHQLLLSRLVEVGEIHGLHTVAITFDRHPLDLLAPSKVPPQIQTVRDRAVRLSTSGVDWVLVLPFTEALADMDPRKFVEDVIVKQVGANHAVVGENFRFGKGRAGGSEMLRTLGKELGFGVDVVPPLILGHDQISSTLIRRKIEEGDVSRAAEFLGGCFKIKGTVVQGQGLGRQLGFPTANIQTAPNQLLPGNGIYAVNAHFQKTHIRGAANVGVRPTVNSGAKLLEVHLIGFQGDLYNQEMEVEFLEKLRDESKFNSVVELTEQIQRDVHRAVSIPDCTIRTSTSAGTTTNIL